NNIIVSAYQQGSDENGENLKNNSGSVYAFTKQGNTWVQTQKIVASDRSDADFFGYSIDIDNNYLVVGAYLQDYNSTGASYIMDAGAAYVYKKEGETWTEKQKLTAGDRKTESYFGYSVSISGDYIIVGAYKHSENSNLNQSGVAYIFKNNSDNWQEQTKLKSSDLTANDYFGKSVAIDGTYALVGADLQDNDENGENFSFNAGAAYLFKLENNNWTETQKLCASDRSGSAAYGFKLAIHDYNFIVCANQEDYDVNGENYLNNSGSAYIYRKNSNLIVKKGNEIINNEQTLNFGNLIFEEEFQEINISFSNDGGDIIKFTDEEIFVLQGNDIEDFSLEFDENLDTLLMPNTTAYLNIKFSPTSLGLKNAELLINNDTEQSEFLILLKGNGILLSKLSNINSNILVFPNPGNSQIFIDLKDTEADIINIYDANAKCVISKTNAKGLINIDTSNLQTGVYLLSIISDNTIVNSKFIIE
ncbi:MAG: T9SS type A sorting domain-containing protein, partial [Bacteroidales bacterium]|nr:T9SS type A sorting domain-containing protein [Bacteroidales bacterium]